jgi:hypothetical protein
LILEVLYPRMNMARRASTSFGIPQLSWDCWEIRDVYM